MNVTVETASEREAIERIVQLYINGASKGDVAKLNEAFHPDARMFGSLGGERVDVPISEMIAMSESQPLESDGSYRATVRTLEQVGDAATVTISEEGCWGGVSFVDFFSLSKINGTWKIVNKTFAHTGGQPRESGEG
jgi:hypothetical protein